MKRCGCCGSKEIPDENVSGEADKGCLCCIVKRRKETDTMIRLMDTNLILGNVTLGRISREEGRKAIDALNKGDLNYE